MKREPALVSTGIKARAFIVVLILCCFNALLAQEKNETPADQVIKEIFTVESEFQQMTGTGSIAEAFRFFAADDAVLNRDNILVEGKEAIYAFYDQKRYENVQVTWAPDKVVVSESGDLACSYGKYQWEVVDEEGEKQRLTGIYMTVWKRQPDGSWRYIWD